MVYECLICEYKTTVNSNYHKHLKTQKHLKKEAESIQKEAESIPKEAESILDEENSAENKEFKNKFECIWCRRFFSRNDNLERHLKICNKKNNNELTKINIFNINNNSDNKCCICLKIFTNKYTLNRHNKTFHSQNEKNVKKTDKIHIIETKTKELEDTITSHHKVTTNNKDLIFNCKLCLNKYKHQRSLTRHLYYCKKRHSEIKEMEQRKNIEIENIKKEKEIEKLQAINEEKEKRLQEKDLRIADQAKAIEIAKNSKNITINNTSNKTINYLNTHFGDMIAMEQFLKALEHTHQLTLQERQDLLNAYYDCGIEVFARNFSFIMKQNCKRQLEAQGLKDMKLLPLFCSDGNLRSHKEKQLDGWKTLYDNQSINHMLNISNQQIHESYQQIVPISGKERSRIYKEIKRDNHQNMNLKNEAPLGGRPSIASCRCAPTTPRLLWAYGL